MPRIHWLGTREEVRSAVADREQTDRKDGFHAYQAINTEELSERCQR